VRRKIHTADALLKAWFETQNKLTGGASFIAIEGKCAQRDCANPKCTGHPKMTEQGWKCSGCSKRWPMESAVLLKNEFSSSRRAGARDSLRVRLADFSIRLERLRRDQPWPHAAWTTHVIGLPDPKDHRLGIGIPLELVGGRLIRMFAAGMIDAPPAEGFSSQRVNSWVWAARRAIASDIPRAGL